MLRAQLVFLAVDEHAGVVKVGRDDQGAGVDVGLEKRGQCGRGAEALAHVAQIAALADHDFIDSRLKPGNIGAARTGVALPLAVDRQLPWAGIGDDARPLAETGDQNGDHVPRGDWSGEGGQLPGGDREGERSVSVRPGDFHRVRAWSHLIEHQLAILQIDRRLAVDDDLALFEIGEQAHGRRLRLEQETKCGWAARTV